MKRNFGQMNHLSLHDYTKLMTDVANADIVYRNGQIY